MAKPPAEVRFPGDKNRRKRLRVRGIKQASKEIQRRLEKNLDALLDNPEGFLPEIVGELGKVSLFGSKDPMALTLRELEGSHRRETMSDGSRSGWGRGAGATSLAL